MKRSKTCCFTGHRQICAEHFMRLPELLDSLLGSLIQKDFRHFKAGGAVGFDTLCALKCLELKKKYPDLAVSLELCLPCRDQTNGWSEQEKSIYRFILERADKVTYEQERYAAGCMHARNRRLVSGSDLCVAYLSSSRGGTAYTCSYAAKNGVEVLNLFETLTRG